jgi:ADP-ribosylglycohydrolase
MSRYLYSYHTKKYDLGETTKIVYESLKSRVQNESQRSPVNRESFLFDQSIIDETAKLTDSTLGNKTAGCGPASRSFPLALCHWIDDDDLFGISKKEATLTHHHRLAGEVAGIVNLICRSLLRNKPWQVAVQSAFLAPSLHDDVSDVCLRYGRSMNSNVNVHPAYAPRVLLEALQYVTNWDNLTEALRNLNVKKNFYALPIIGVLLGARWGIPLEIFQDKINDPRLKTIRDIANNFSRGWNPENESANF